MTPHELAIALKTLGWSKAELCRRTGCHPNSATRWTEDGATVPGPIAAYVRLSLLVDAMVRELTEAGERR